jgi:hypothetical protein
LLERSILYRLAPTCNPRVDQIAECLTGRESVQESAETVVTTDSRTTADSTDLAISLEITHRTEERHPRIVVSLLNAALSAALNVPLTGWLLVTETAERRDGVAKISAPVAMDLMTVIPVLLMTIARARETEIGLTALPSDLEIDTLTNKMEGEPPSYRVAHPGTLPWPPQDPRSLNTPTELL